MRYNTNLASEFYVMSVLYRLGLEPQLTLGNTKSIDIAVLRGRGKALTIDVKGVAGKDTWLVGRQAVKTRQRHSVVLVSYEGRFATRQHPPRCWVVPHEDFLPFVSRSRTGSAYYVKRKQVMNRGEAFEDAWHLMGAEVGRDGSSGWSQGIRPGRMGLDPIRPDYARLCAPSALASDGNRRVVALVQ